MSYNEIYQMIGPDAMALMGVSSQDVERGVVAEGDAERRVVSTFTSGEVDNHVATLVKTFGGGEMLTLDLVESWLSNHPGNVPGLAAAVCRRLGVRQLDEANPLHDPETGEFTSLAKIVSKGGGSKSFYPSTGTFAEKAKNAKMKAGKAIANWVGTKRPCGRAARVQGKNIRCHDGAVLTGTDDDRKTSKERAADARSAKASRKKQAKVVREALAQAMADVLAEMKSGTYNE